MRSARRITLNTLVIGVFALVVYVIAIASYEFWIQATIGPKIEQELGFKLGTPYIEDGSWLGAEVIELESFEAGSVFDEAGFIRGEIVVEPRTLGKVYRLLNGSRGKPVTITTVAGGDGEPIGDRQKRRVTFAVPRSGRP